jgi:YHS domain-containing protein
MPKDPVCKMDVKESNAVATATYEAKTYYFCSESCKARFVENPTEYVG